MLVQIFHIAVTAYYLFVSHWMIEHVVKQNDAIKDAHIRTLKQYSNRFLTNWTFTIQVVYFVSCVLEDILHAVSGNERLKSKLRNVKTYFFTVLAAPAAILVAAVFWSLWAIDRNLIFPKVLDLIMPPWVNHSLHTTTAIFVVGEMYLCHHIYPSVKQALPGITLYLGLYTVCLMSTYFLHGVWLYPFFRHLDWNMRIVFCLGTYLFGISIFVISKFTNSLIWSKASDTVSKKKQKKKH